LAVCQHFSKSAFATPDENAEGEGLTRRSRRADKRSPKGVTC
jgi:hypothetical protein